MSPQVKNSECEIADSAALIITDEAPEYDRRVNQSTSEYKSHQIKIIQNEISQIKIINYIIAIFIIMRALSKSIPILIDLFMLTRVYKRSCCTHGLLAAWRSILRAVDAGRKMKSAKFVHAHNLYSAAAALAMTQRVESFVYDSHEIQFHRNRKSGAFRILIEAGLERMIIQKANEVRVVNHAILDIMKKLHNHTPPIRVLYNDFYSSYDLVSPPNDSIPAFVYVGKGLSGRMLEMLDRPPDALGADVFVFHFGAKMPEYISGAHWNIGPADYENALKNLVQKRRCIMWCCHDNVCLSYKYATPNKFFQALAIGMPVVALKGTYLSEIVGDFCLGPSYQKGESLDKILKNSRTSVFERWRENTIKLHKNLRSGEVKI